MNDSDVSVSTVLRQSLLEIGRVLRERRPVAIVNIEPELIGARFRARCHEVDLHSRAQIEITFMEELLDINPETWNEFEECVANVFRVRAATDVTEWWSLVPHSHRATHPVMHAPKIHYPCVLLQHLHAYPAV